MEVQPLVNYPHQSRHHYDPRPALFPLFDSQLDQRSVRHMPSPYHRPGGHYSLHDRRPSPPSESDHRQERLPPINDLIQFAQESEKRAAEMQQQQQQPRHDRSWPRSTLDAPLRLETSNIDPRLHRHQSPPMPRSAPNDVHRSPMYNATHSPPAHRSAAPYPTSTRREHRGSFNTTDHQKRLSVQSQLSISSSQSGHSVHPSSPEASTATSYSAATSRSYGPPSALMSQRALPGDFPPSQHTPVSPQPSLHSPPPSSVAATGYRDPHPYMAPSSQQPMTTASAASSVSGHSATQERYVCPTCAKAFSRPSSLKIHSHSHTGEKPYRCSRKACGKAFSVRSNMKRHERGCHMEGQNVTGADIDRDAMVE